MKKMEDHGPRQMTPEERAECERLTREAQEAMRKELEANYVPRFVPRNKRT